MIGDRLPSSDREVLRTSASMVARWLTMRGDVFALLHGDFRADNLLFDGDGSQVTVVDWQTITIGLPARDLAYFIGTSLPHDDRRAYERQLVETYHAALVDAGVTDYDLETCWNDYRLAMLQIPLIITLGAAFAAGSSRGDDIVVVMLERACVAIRELGTLDLIAAE
jgi:aminoglycoside/choline kinase family phosphotransferase